MEEMKTDTMNDQTASEEEILCIWMPRKRIQ